MRLSRWAGREGRDPVGAEGQGRLLSTGVTHSLLGLVSAASPQVLSKAQEMTA